MIFIRNQPQNQLTCIRQKSIQAFQHLTVVHNKFYNQLLKYQCDKQTIIQKIVTLSQAEEVLLLDLCSHFENSNIVELGQFIMKMHIQSMEIIRWLVSHLGQFAKEKIADGTTDDIYSKIKSNQLLQRRLQRENPNHYYRIKQNSIFAAQGISYQIKKIQEQVQNNHKFQINELKNILNNKQLVDRIQASQNEKILYQAVDIISHQSEVFRKLTKNNKQAFKDNYKDLNVKPYTKLKAQIEEAMKQKIVKANQKLFNKLDKYIKNKVIAVKEKENRVSHQTVGVQTNFAKQLEQKYVRQDKKKGEKIRQLTSNLNYHKTRADKLQNLMREKANYFEQKLVKARFQKSKHNEIEILKKSATQMTSIKNINQYINNQFFKSQEKEQKQQVELVKSIKIIATSSPQPKKHKKLKLRQECIYQKSLMRIQFDLSNQFDDSSDIKSNERKSIKLSDQKNLCISNLQVNFMYNPSDNVEAAKETKQSRPSQNRNLNIFSNTFDFGFNFCNTPLTNRNQSLLTITNIRSAMKNGGQKQNLRKSTVFHKVAHSSQFSRQSCKNIKNFHRNPNKLFTEKFVIQYDSQNQKQKQKASQRFKDSGRMRSRVVEGNMIYFTNKLQSQQNQVAQVTEEQHFEQKVEKKEAKDKIQKLDLHIVTKPIIKRNSKQKFKVMNNFQLLNFNSEDYFRNKGKINTMMADLKRKRKNREGLKSQKCAAAEVQHFDPEIILQLYFNEENAMEAQLEFGVSVSNLIAERRTHKQNMSEGYKINTENEQFIQNMSKKIQKFLYGQRRKSPKIWQQLQFILKCPLSFIKGVGIDGELIRQDLAHQDIKNFVTYVSNLHFSCGSKPCPHLKTFLSKIGMNFTD